MTRITAEVFALRAHRVRLDLLDQFRRDEIERLTTKTQRHREESNLKHQTGANP